MRNSRLWLSVFSAGLVLGLGATVPGAKAAYPERTVHVITGAAPAGGTDFMARLIAQKLGEKWGQAVIVENRTGADNAIAGELVAKAPPDGYMIDVISPNHTITPAFNTLPYDPVKSFTPVAMVARQPQLLVINPTYLHVNTVKELIAYVKTKPGQMNFGSTGIGSLPTLEMELLAKKTGMDLVNITFKGGGPGLVALLGGEIQMAFNGFLECLPLVQSGKLKALAVDINVRAPLLPDVPTVAEAADLPDFNFGNWYGILAPPGTPKDIVKKIHDDVETIMKSDDVSKRLAEQGLLASSSTPEEFTQFLATDIRNWGDFVKGLKTK